MKRPVILALAASAALLGAGAAHAGNVHWSVGVNLPPVATVISNGPVWGAPAYYPAPVTYAPPVVYEAPVVYPSYGVRAADRLCAAHRRAAVLRPSRMAPRAARP